jgi:hypothetical protein
MTTTITTTTTTKKSGLAMNESMNRIISKTNFKIEDEV